MLRVYLAVVVAVLLVAVGAVALMPLVMAPAEPPRPVATGEALIGGPFELVDQHGRTVTDQDFAGRHMLVFFGFTYCPDFCPMSLDVMTRALELLPEDEAARIVPIFITLDPERDDVEQMRSYAALFYDDLVALTGTREAIDAAASAYRVYHAKVELDAGADYTIDHSTFTYLMGPDGRYLTHFGHDASPEEMAERLLVHLRAN